MLVGDQKHIINKQVLELRLNDKKDAHLIQDAFSRAYWNHIPSVIERIIDKYSSINEIIKIDKLEIDIGGISIDKLNSDFPQKVERVFEEFFIAQLHKKPLETESDSATPKDYRSSKPNEINIQIKSDVENNFEILNHFLLTGTIPWWCNKDSEFTIQKLVEELLEKSPLKLKNLLFNLFLNPNTIKRFTFQLPEKIIIKTLNVLTPINAPMLLELMDVLLKVQSIHPFVDDSEMVFKEKLWHSILKYITDNQNTFTTSQKYEVELIKYIASQFIIQSKNENINQNDLFNFLSKISESIENTIAKNSTYTFTKLDSSIKLLLNKTKELDNTESPIPNISTKENFKEKSELDIFIHFLQTGNLEYDNEKENNPSIQILAENLLDKISDKTRTTLLNLLEDKLIRKRFITQFSDDFIIRTLKILVPSAASLIVEFGQNIAKVLSYKPSTNLSNEKFRENIWNLILIYITKNQQLFRVNSSDGVESMNSLIIYYLDRITLGKINIIEILGNKKIGEEEKKDIDRFIKINNIEDITQYPNDTEEIDEVNLTNKPIITSKSISKKQNLKNKSESENTITDKSSTNIKNKDGLDKETINERQIINNKTDSGNNIIDKSSTSSITNKHDLVAESINGEQIVRNKPESENTIIDKSAAISITNKHDLDTESANEKQTFEGKSVFKNPATTKAPNQDHADIYPQPEFDSEHISNAGLALLWPFLTMFFERLNLIKDKKFINDEAKYRAIHLLQYLATEQEETPENDLLFNKILCGTDIYEPIPLGFKITENEIEECNALLQSVIDNWTVLKNTSIHTLRTTFLQKEGILSKQTNGWKLYIERTTIDVLLDRLPWGISMILLPWSNKMIYVEW